MDGDGGHAGRAAADAGRRAGADRGLSMALFTFSFFAAHSVASSWVGRRARGANALASALYLFFYYVGSSVVGSLCGVVWSSEGWPGVVVLLALVLGAALAIALHLRGLEPCWRSRCLSLNPQLLHIWRV
ncbi:hypothetical protein LP419_08875 [Massilia sp. H-1]|nr:hypothetical protein LP419_08875 [Massilia sp. H-1]